MTNNTFRLSCEQLEGRDLPSPLGGVRAAPAIQRPALSAPAVQRMPAPVVTPVQTPAVATQLTPTPETMSAPTAGTTAVPSTGKLGDQMWAISKDVGTTATMIRVAGEEGVKLLPGPWKVVGSAVATAGKQAGRVNDALGAGLAGVDAANETGSGWKVVGNVAVSVGSVLLGSRLVTVAVAVVVPLPVKIVVAGAIAVSYALVNKIPVVKDGLKVVGNGIGSALEWFATPSRDGTPAPRMMVPRGR